MPETIQGQFEKRLYLNTKIKKSDGTYTAEEPHGLAFVEELKNNYITEVPDTSITLGNGTVSVIIEGPTSISGGLALSDRIPHSTSSRLYNNGGELYWNGSKVGNNYNFISEGTTVLHLGPSAQGAAALVQIKTQGSLLIEGPNGSHLSIGPNGLQLEASKTKILASSLTIGPNGFEINDSAIFIGPANAVQLDSKKESKNPTASKFFDGPSLSLLKEYNFFEEFVRFSTSDTSKSISFKGPLGKIIIWPQEKGTMFFNGPVAQGNTEVLPSTFIIGPVQVNGLPTAFVNQDTDNQQGKAVINLNNNLYYATPNHSEGVTGPISYYDYNAQSEKNQKINMSYIDVPHWYVDDAHKGAGVTLENNTIYIFDPDHDVDLTDVKIKHWNTPQLHLYFNNEVSGKTKMTFTYPESWKWINETTSPTDSDFTAGHMYCITLRSLQNPVYDSSSDTPPFNQEYIIIANIAYDVPIDERTASNT